MRCKLAKATEVIIGVAKRRVVTSSKFMVLYLMHVASSKFFV